MKALRTLYCWVQPRDKSRIDHTAFTLQTAKTRKKLSDWLLYFHCIHTVYWHGKCVMLLLMIPANCYCLIAMSYQVMHDSVRLCSDRGQVLATYPAEKLAFSACCPDDRRFFGLVTMQATDDLDDCHFSNGRDEEGGLRTSCHVFIVDPELCHHQVWIKRKWRDEMRCYKSQWKGDNTVQFITTLNPLLLRTGFYFLFTLFCNKSW